MALLPSVNASTVIVEYSKAALGGQAVGALVTELSASIPGCRAET